MAGFAVEARSSVATRSASFGRRTANVTAAFAAASARAVSTPIPAAPPVTMQRAGQINADDDFGGGRREAEGCDDARQLA
jgi:hypothetical protein